VEKVGTLTVLAEMLGSRFGCYLLVRVATGFAVQIEAVAIGWQIYDTTHSPFLLGLAGLSQFLPALLLVLVTGDVADRFSRRTIVALCLIVEATTALALALLVLSGESDVRVVLGLLLFFGAARAFFQPAFQAILPTIVPEEKLSTAIAVNAGAQQITTIAGPVMGGLLYAVSPGSAFLSVVAILIAGLPFAFFLQRKGQAAPAPAPRDLRTLLAGFRYIWHQKVVRGAISLDLFAVLLGGATALLPIFAQDILHTGPEGLGLLRAAPAVGAIAVAAYLAFLPIRDHAGVIMLATIIVFGASVAVFGVSETFWISLVALAIMGGADMISVYVRNTLVQLWTPDRLRGRVNAVNMVFIGASNELGAFRAGSFASVMGAPMAVIAGGVATVVIGVLWAGLFPELRRVRKLQTPDDPFLVVEPEEKLT
jgi:MFS family permease